MSLAIVMADDGIEFDGRVKDEQPLGGAETAFAELAEALARRGHRVAAYARCAARLDWKGVQWIPLGEGLPDSADLYIASRAWTLLLGCPRARHAAFWLHNPGSYLLKWRYQWRLARRRPILVFLGPYHFTTYPRWGMGGERVEITYGISEPFLHGSEREPPPPRATFQSNPLRSLDWLLEVWAARIAPRVPGAELHIFGGAQVYGSAGVANAARVAPILERARALAGQGVVLRGAFGKAELARELTRSRCFLYRGDLGELFCNAVVEPQAMGVPGVVEDIACMSERVRDGTTGFVVRGQEAFARAAIRLLTDDALWRTMHRNCLTLQRSLTWDAAAAGFERLALGAADSTRESRRIRV